MLRMLEAQAPAKQNATDTITTLSARLNNATLLEDRRAAILGLRSFAKEYPASVASGSLRGLISCLSKDLDDVDTTKVVLETLLMLFNPNADSVGIRPILDSDDLRNADRRLAGGFGRHCIMAGRRVHPGTAANTVVTRAVLSSYSGKTISRPSSNCLRVKTFTRVYTPYSSSPLSSPLDLSGRRNAFSMLRWEYRG
jgi:hypothetical protein